MTNRGFSFKNKKNKKLKLPDQESIFAINKKFSTPFIFKLSSKFSKTQEYFMNNPLQLLQNMQFC